MRIYRLAVLFGVLVILPVVSHAQVYINEIMYDLPGTDSGREWIEIYNAGSDAVDKLIVAIEPYSDLLGFKADAKKLIEVKSIEDRIVFLVNTLGKISPELDKISGLGSIRATAEHMLKMANGDANAAEMNVIYNRQLNKYGSELGSKIWEEHCDNNLRGENHP